MYDNLTLYYLNQMGIFPWVSKTCYDELKTSEKNEAVLSPEPSSISSAELMSDSPLTAQKASASHPYKLLILTPEHLSAKARSLLHAISIFLNLPDKDLLQVQLANNRSLVQQQLTNASIEFNSIPFTLVFGLNKDLLEVLNPMSTVVYCQSLDHLLHQSMSKKTTWLDLLEIKNKFKAL